MRTAWLFNKGSANGVGPMKIPMGASGTLPEYSASAGSMKSPKGVATPRRCSTSSQ